MNFWNINFRVCAYIYIHVCIKINPTQCETLLSGFGDVDDIGPGLHFVELCAGSHRLTSVALEYNLKAIAMDAASLDEIKSKDPITFVEDLYHQHQ